MELTDAAAALLCSVTAVAFMAHAHIALTRFMALLALAVFLVVVSVACIV